MSSIGSVGGNVPPVSTRPPPAPPPAKPVSDADGDKDGSTSSKSDRAVDIKT
jgi:hypothetical protein